MFSFLLSILYNVWFLAGFMGKNGGFPKPLTPAEEENYISLMKKGDKNAKNILIEHNLRLVAHIAKKYSPKGCDSEDLISIGTIGLIKGITSFKGEKGTRLATYAARCIDNEILMYIRSSKKLQNEISIDDTIGSDKDGNEITLMDILEDNNRHVDDEVNIKLMSSALRKKINTLLTADEIEILTKRYGLDNTPVQTQSVIAQNMGISRSYVSRIEKRAIEKLRREIIG